MNFKRAPNATFGHLFNYKFKSKSKQAFIYRHKSQAIPYLIYIRKIRHSSTDTTNR